ncbi:hypothetical protein B0J12DRAFT_666114 [Macrophomina phaseolina]|uniref:Secreted protein n=1 Tax=Macrophomina phaseolina TaxID=35725 RepID=A0ABQ8G916_9PEZI|nr:hypothetical protein B0J12DRAFT_666114 [Macrophomina phaseolina]
MHLTRSSLGVLSISLFSARLFNFFFPCVRLHVSNSGLIPCTRPLPDVRLRIPLKSGRAVRFLCPYSTYAP